MAEHDQVKDVGFAPTIEEVMEYAEKVYERRMDICRAALPCPHCGTRQVQLVAYSLERPSEWKCRECRYKWETP